MKHQPLPRPLHEMQMEEGSGFIHELWDWTKSILFAVIFVLLIHWFVFVISPIDGHSMEPTLQDQQWLFVNKLELLISAPERGDIVILEEPNIIREEPLYLVKRIVAGPGDKVEIKDQQLYVNGTIVDEPYTESVIEDEAYFGIIELQSGEYFVMGDNRYRLQSRDSRSFGPVQEDDLIGRAQFVIWPLSQWKSL